MESRFAAARRLQAGAPYPQPTCAPIDRRESRLAEAAGVKRAAHLEWTISLPVLVARLPLLRR